MRYRVGERALGLSAAAAVAVGVAGCSSAPTPEEVIDFGAHLPAGDRWCQVLTADQVGTLLGAGDLDRVRETGAIGPDASVGQNCEVVWADGDEPVRLASAYVNFRWGDSSVDSLTNLRNLLGEDGERLAGGEVEELRPGVYLQSSDDSLHVFQACAPTSADAEDRPVRDGAPLPTVLTGAVSLSPAPEGEPLTGEELAQLGEVLTERMHWANQYPCAGEARPLGAEDWQPLVDLVFAD
ncbi:hypothetical protein [Georgenia faecalis]|uniref:DUF3558 domain-containing protein n=1 Tax=Georgenia faecalis TaxID=2483799 RepID=A0ABV9D5J7_9MICO|nr:hypothetical protein [Georgenia faecalis]